VQQLKETVFSGDQLKNPGPLATIAVILLLTSGCISPTSDFDFNPLFRSACHQEQESSDRDIFIPFFSTRSSPDISSWTLRPLMTSKSDESRQRFELDFLPPFGRYANNEYGTNARFWPIYSYTKTYHSGAGEDVDWVVFPILYGGHSHDGEDYFAFFPFGGRVRDFLSYDTFDFVLWPLFQQVTKIATGVSVSTSILWLFAWTHGGDRDGSFQALPFYMHRKWKDKYDKYSVLWPFFHYQKLRLDSDHPATMYSVWPLFLHEKSDNHYRFGLIGPLLFMGPFIQLASETPDLWEGKPNFDSKSYYNYDLPWPLVHIEKTRDYEKFRIFPFYSHFSQPGFDSKAYLIPFFWLRKEQNDKYNKTSFFFTPIFHYNTKEYNDGSGEDTYCQLWPIFHNTIMANGARDFSTLSLIPYRTEKWLASLEEVLWPFWNIYRRRVDNSGASRHSALFGLFSYYQDRYESRFSVPILYNNKYFHKLGWEHNFLFGLFSVGGDNDGLNKLRLLYIPIIDP